MSGDSIKVSLFKAKDETINLYLPLVIFASFLLISQTGLAQNEHASNLLFVISNIIFLNVVHNIFSLFILTDLPEIQPYLKDHFKTQPFHVGYRSLSVFVFFFVLMWVFPQFKTWGDGGPYLFWTAVLLMQFFALYYHTLRQIEGLCVLYNQNMKNWLMKHQPESINEIDQLQRKEKILFKSFLVISCLGYAFNIFKMENWIFPTFLLSSANLILIFVVNLKAPHWNQSNKWIYLTRLIAFTAGIRYPILGAVVPFFHGIEYFFVTKKLFTKSAVQSIQMQRRVWRYMVPVSILVGILAIFRLDRGFGLTLMGQEPGINLFIVILSCLSFAISFVHFYIDSFIFKMKESGIRNSVGKLLA